MLILSWATIFSPITAHASNLDKTLESQSTLRYEHIIDYAQTFLTQLGYYEQLTESELLYNFYMTLWQYYII